LMLPAMMRMSNVSPLAEPCEVLLTVTFPRRFGSVLQDWNILCAIRMSHGPPRSCRVQFHSVGCFFFQSFQPVAGMWLSRSDVAFSIVPHQLNSIMSVSNSDWPSRPISSQQGKFTPFQPGEEAQLMHNFPIPTCRKGEVFKLGIISSQLPVWP
jgi:hypothetical protein